MLSHMVKRIKRLVKEIIYDPVRARIAYDLVIAIFSLGFCWSLFKLFSFPTASPYVLFLYPFIYVTLNHLFGVYGPLKTAHIILKILALLGSSTTALMLFVFVGQPPLILILTTVFVSMLTIIPRIFFNFGNTFHRNTYIDTIVHDKLPVLVVGGGGYIGSHVVEKLLKEGFKVHVFDKFIYGKEVLSDLAKNKNLELIEGDISDIYSLTLALTDVQAVIHLAGLVGDPACALDDKLTRHINIVSTRMLKESVKAFRIPKFIFASSCSVYGSSEEEVNETSPLNPVSLYARTKIDAENEIMQDQFDLFHPTVLRFSTVFGHSKKPRFDLVANLFAAQAYYDGVITVTGSNQWRPFVHVADVADAVVRIVQAPKEKVSRQVFNVGDDRLNITIGDLAKIVASVIKKSKKGKKVKILVKDDVADRRNYHVSFSKIKNILGFEAQHMLQDGIEEIYDHFKKGTYKKPYKNSYYSNAEMAKQMKTEFYSNDYQKTHFSLMADNS